MESVKIAVYVGLANVSKILFALIILKLTANKFGAEGLGFIGNYMTLVAAAITVSGGGVFNAASKYTSEYFNNKHRLDIFLTNALIYSLGIGLIIALLGLLYAKEITNYVFGNVEYVILIKFFFAAQWFSGIVNFVYGLLNGLGKVRVYSVIVVLSNIIATVLGWVIISVYGVLGVLITLTCSLIIPIVSAIYVLFDSKIKFNLIFDRNFLAGDIVNLAKFAVMLGSGLISFSLIEIYIRNIVIESLGISAAGQWQAVIRLSSAYLSFGAAFLSFYIIPKASKGAAEKVIAEMAISAMKFTTLIFSFILTVVYFLGEWIIPLVLSESFLVIDKILMQQICGDYFRMIGWVVGFVVISKASMKLYVVIELFQGGLYLLCFKILFAEDKNLSSLMSAYMISNIVYSVIMIFGLILYFRFVRMREIGDVTS